MKCIELKAAYDSNYSLGGAKFIKNNFGMLSQSAQLYIFQKYKISCKITHLQMTFVLIKYKLDCHFPKNWIFTYLSRT